MSYRKTFPDLLEPGAEVAAAAAGPEVPDRERPGDGDGGRVDLKGLRGVRPEWRFLKP